MSASATQARMLAATERDLLADMVRFGADLADRRARIDAVAELLGSVERRLARAVTGTGLSSAAPIEPCGLARPGFNPIAQGDGA